MALSLETDGCVTQVAQSRRSLFACSPAEGQCVFYALKYVKSATSEVGNEQGRSRRQVTYGSRLSHFFPLSPFSLVFKVISSSFKLCNDIVQSMPHMIRWTWHVFHRAS